MDSAGSSPVVVLENACTRVVPGREDHAALSEVSLSLLPGHIYALLGPKGAGKSDLLRLLAGRIVPTSGLVRYGASLGASQAAVAHATGYCAQHPELSPDLSIGDHLSLFAAIANVPAEERATRIEQVASRLGFSDSLGRLTCDATHELQQRLHVALSMLHGPRLWLLDEPFMGLEESAQETLWSALTEHRAREGTAVLACRDFARVQAHADRVLLLCRGRLSTQSSPRVLSQRHGSLEHAYAALTGERE